MRRFPYIMAVATLALALCSCNVIESAHDETKYAQPVYQAVAIDGDTFAQGNERVHYRLARIDAPEMPGHCRPGRRCVPGDPYASQRALQFFLNQQPVCKVVGRDVYQRKLAECWMNAARGDLSGHGDLNDTMMRLGFAEEYRR